MFNLLAHGRRVPPLFAAFLIAIHLAGCGGDDTGGYDRFLLSQDEAAGKLKAMGGDASRKNYPPMGEGWVVKLAGATITDETFEHLKLLQRIAELDLSKSTITDAQMSRVMEVGGTLYKLNLSNTAITDASIAPMADLRSWRR